MSNIFIKVLFVNKFDVLNKYEIIKQRRKFTFTHISSASCMWALFTVIGEAVTKLIIKDINNNNNILYTTLTTSKVQIESNNRILMKRLIINEGYLQYNYNIRNRNRRMVCEYYPIRMLIHINGSIRILFHYVSLNRNDNIDIFWST